MRLGLYVFLLVSGAALFSSQARAAQIEAVSSPVAATVFSDRATVTRTAKITIPAGAHTVVFKGLPAALFPDSLRVEGEGSMNAVLGALSHRTVNEADFPDERMKALDLQLEDLNRQRDILNAEKAALAKQQAFYESLGAQASDRAGEEISTFKFNTEQWALAAETILNGVDKASKAVLEKNRLIGEIDKQAEKITRDIAQLRGSRKSSVEVSLPVEAKGGGQMDIRLSYQLSNVTWRPVYDARLDTKTGALRIVQYGAVRQNTGEDWEQVALALSTARPQRGAFLPELPPMWVDIAEPAIAARMEGFAAADMAMESLSAAPMVAAGGHARKQSAPPQEPRFTASVAPAQIDTGGFTAEYKIPAPSTVLSDGTESKLLIGAFETDNVLETHVQPQSGPDAYLIARATLKGDSPILPGSVSLFLDEAYVGQSQLPLLRGGKETRLSFGIDDQIEVERRVLKDETGESGLIIGMQNVAVREYNTGIVNLRQRPVDLVVLETVPAPQNEKITLEILKDKTTQGFEKDADKVKGLVRWRFTLKPGEKKDVALGWKLAWPKDKRIGGLDPVNPF